MKNELSFRYLRGGKIKQIRADLDFRILRRDGRVAYVDCKFFSKDRFPYSSISKDQLRRALCYESYNIPSGFIVTLESIQEVRFYPGHVIFKGGPGASFSAGQGLLLGHLYDFDLRGIFA